MSFLDVIHLLDSDICVNYLRHGQASPAALKIVNAPSDEVGLCSVVVAELLCGARRSRHVVQSLAQVQQFCAQFTSLPFDDAAAEEYGKLRAHLARLGTPIGPNDLLIASIALANGLILVTHNTLEFSRVPGLTLEDWQIP